VARVSGTRRRLLTAALFGLGLLAALAWWQYSPPGAPAPARADEASTPLPTRFAWARGHTAALRVQLQAEAEIDFATLSAMAQSSGGGAAAAAAGNDPSTLSLQAEGVLWLRSFPPIDAQAQHISLAGVLTSPEYRVDGEVQDAGALQRVFVVDVDSAGRFAALRTPQGLPESALGMLRTTLDALQVVLPGQDGESWQDFETLDGDPLRTQYRRRDAAAAGGGIALHKQGTLAPPALIGTRDGEAAPHYPPGLGGIDREAERRQLGLLSTRHQVDAQLRLAADPMDWLQGAEVDVEIERQRQGRRVGSTRYRVTATALSAAEVARGHPLLPGSLDQALASLAQPWLDPARHHASEALLATLGEDPSADAVARLYASLQGSRLAEVEQLVLDYLRRFPQRADDLMQFLRGEGPRQLPRDAELSLWRLLAAAGTAESQQAMLTALTDDSAGEQAQWRAALHLGEITTPSAATLQQLLQFAQQSLASDSASLRGIGNSALLAAGSLAGPAGSGATEEQQELADLVAASLKQQFLGSQQPGERRVVLAAIGNQGHPDNLDVVAAALDLDDPETRSQAFQALRFMPPGQALPLLQQGFSRETDSRVQVAALATLADWPPSRSSLDWAQARLQESSRPEVQSALVAVLGAARQQYPEADEALRALLARQPPREVRAAIHAQLGSN